MTVLNNELFSSCVDPRYRIPLFLNLTTLTTVSGSYYNGTAKVNVPSESEQVLIRLHLSNLTASAPELQAATLAANSVAGNP